VKVVNYPYCGFEGVFKLINTWWCRWWNVRLFECPRCDYILPPMLILRRMGFFVILYKPRVRVRR